MVAHQHIRTTVQTTPNGIRVYCLDCNHTYVREAKNRFEEKKIIVLTQRFRFDTL